MHKESGHGTFGGVVPVIGGLVIAAAAGKYKEKNLVKIQFGIEKIKRRFTNHYVHHLFSNLVNMYILPATSAKAMMIFIFSS